MADVFRQPHDLAEADAIIDEEYILAGSFALLQAEAVTVFLQHDGIPHIDQNLGLVEDVSSTTDFQDPAIQDVLCEWPSRWPHSILDLRCDTDLKKVEWACLRLVEHFEILRTVFVATQGRFSQVILRSVKPQCNDFETQDYVHSFVNAICETNLKRRRRLGSAFVRCMAIQGMRGENKLVFRLSHAQYDGYSLQSLFETLAPIYDRVNFLPNPAPLCIWYRHGIEVSS